VIGNDSAAISHDFGINWTPVSPSNWDNEMDFCWDNRGQTLLLFSSDNLAMSIDGGQSWQRFEEDYNLNPTCGIANSYLWLRHREFAVYQREEDASQ